MRTNEVNCLICGAKIAWWGGGYNRQYQNEWECDNKSLRRRVPEGVIHRKHSTTFSMGGKFRSEDEGGLKYEYLHCSISNNAVYCGTCARKLRFKCNKCRTGRIKLTRKVTG